MVESGIRWDREANYHKDTKSPQREKLEARAKHVFFIGARIRV